LGVIHKQIISKEHSIVIFFILELIIHFFRDILALSKARGLHALIHLGMARDMGVSLLHDIVFFFKPLVRTEDHIFTIPIIVMVIKSCIHSVTTLENVSAILEVIVTLVIMMVWFSKRVDTDCGMEWLLMIFIISLGVLAVVIVRFK